MIPKKSFCIWFTVRSGSTLLCKSLEATGVAGKAGEFLNIPEGESFLNHYQVENFQALREKLWQQGCSENEIMGIKYSLYRFHHDKIARQMAEMRKMKDLNLLDWELWSCIFPNCCHIYLTRRNKIRQVVSWWKAIQNQIWHLEQGQAQELPPKFYDDKYNYDALMHLLKEINLREAAMEEYFKFNEITPFPVVYEDFIRDYEATIYSILSELGLDHSTISIGPKPLKKTSDKGSEIWVQRFRHDLQKTWDRQMW